MNRSALCIKMLNLLNSRGVMKREELAEELDTNVRNIAEFKKELETSGYVIDSIRGKDGGYILNKERIFPSVAASEDEVKSLNEALKYLKANNFINYNNFLHLSDKIKAGLKDPASSEEVYYLYGANIYSLQDRQMRSLISKAKDDLRVIEFEYKSVKSNTYKLRKVCPYEILNTEDGYYINAYDLTSEKKSYKNFKIVDTRMRNVIITQRKFSRDLDYKVENHVGNTGLFKEMYFAELEISGLSAKIINEKNIGIGCTKEFKNNILHLSFRMENKKRLLEFILSLGKDVKVISPITLKEEIINELHQSLINYN